MMTLFNNTASWCGVKKSSKIRKKGFLSDSSKTQVSILRPLITFFFYARYVLLQRERERERNTHTSADKERFTTGFVFFSPPSSPSEE